VRLVHEQAVKRAYGFVGGPGAKDQRAGKLEQAGLADLAGMVERLLARSSVVLVPPSIVAGATEEQPAVHRLDSARLFRLALEKAPAGSTLHAVADQGVPIREVAETIGRHLKLPVVSVAPENAPEHFAWLAPFLGIDAPASSSLTRELLDWQPTQPGLIVDLDAGHYFREPSA
jgi:nucleoside-diphosphate-sugar epimerase